MNVAVDVQKTVAELILEQPSLIPIFERLGIDYCCGGKKSLREACENRGLDPETVAQTLGALATAGNGHAAAEEKDWSRAGLTELCDHIESTHHAYLKGELPRLTALVGKVSEVHGDRHPDLHRVREIYGGMSREILSHIVEEEEILFPLIRGLESVDKAAPKDSVAAPIRRMESEHDASGDALAVMRELTDGWTPPPDACGSYRAMLQGLQELEHDLHQHIHKENNILFPRSIEVEQSRR